jgi:DNA-binding CsgD family transcriptional regulator
MAKQLLWAGDLPAATALLDEVVASHADAGNELERPYRRYDQAMLCCTAGDLAAAWDHVEDGIRAARDAENLDAEGWMLYPKVLTAAWRGDADLARAAADDLLSWRSRPGSSLGRARAYSALGVLALSEGDHEGAAATLLAAAELLDEIGVAHPGALPVLPDTVVALAGCGRVDEAELLLGRLHDQAKTLDLERVWAMYDHAAGCVALAEGNTDAAVEHVARSIETTERLGLVPEGARAELCLGKALLRAGRRTHGAEALSSARTRFESMGAPLWQARATAELERTQPGRSAGMLTPAESRVADLVSRGAKNKEIAATLYMSSATVEAHLTRVYRKLGIRSRTELARLVVEGTVALSPPSGAS